MNTKRNILVISSIFPINVITGKRNENDIILKTNMLLEDESKNKISFYHAFIFPKSNFILSFLSDKWKEYYYLGKSNSCVTKYDYTLFLFPQFFFPKNRIINKLLFDFGLFINKRKYKKIIKSNNIDVIHAHSVSSDGYLAYRLSVKFNLKLIITVRELGRSMFDEAMILEKAEKIICISKIDEIKIKKEFSEKVGFISHGLDSVFFKGAKNEFYRESVLKIVSVCRLIALKNIDKIIETLANVEFDFIYDIYGEGEELNYLESLIEKHNLSAKIQIKAPVSYDTINELYCNYDIFVMPSFPEALGRVFIEAMASGLIVIGAKNTGVDGIVKDEINGFLIDHKNIHIELLDKFNFILGNKDRLTVISQKAYETSLTFDWENIITEFLEIYE